MKASASITCLPREILIKILTGLPAKCVARLRCSSKFLYSYIPEPRRLAFRINFAFPSHQRGALRLYSVRYTEESQIDSSVQKLDSRGLEWPPGSSCGDRMMCMLRHETGGGAVFDLSTGRRISLPPHPETCGSGTNIGNGGFVVRTKFHDICSFAAVGLDPVSGRYKVFKSTVYYYPDPARLLTRQWVLTLEVDESWREIKSPLFTGYIDAAVHIHGIIYFIPKISDQSPHIVAMDVATEGFMRVIPFPPEYDPYPQRAYGREPWIKLNGRLAFINIPLPEDSDDEDFVGPTAKGNMIEIWTLEITSMQAEWGKQTILLPCEEFVQATSMGFTSNSIGEIVFILFLVDGMLPTLILVYSFRRDFWIRVYLGELCKYPLSFLRVLGGVVHIDDEIATSFLEWNE
nr:putative F-box protein At3g52320 [Ipomoea batatas]